MESFTTVAINKPIIAFTLDHKIAAIVKNIVIVN